MATLRPPGQWGNFESGFVGRSGVGVDLCWHGTVFTWVSFSAMTASMLLPLLLAAAPFPAPSPVPLENCTQAACTTSGEVRVCKCSAPNERSVDLLVVDRPDERRVIWATDTNRGAVTDFSVQQVDLDADGSPELVVASLMSVSDGMEIRSWEVSIVDGTEDVVVHGVAHDLPGDFVKGRALLLTEWTYQAVEKQPEPAFVFVGREYEYRRGALAPTKSPVLRRRYTAEFEQERLKALAASTDGLLASRGFLAHASTQKGADELPRSFKKVSLKALTFDEPEYELHAEDAEGVLLTFSSDGEAGPLLRLGDAKAKRLFPLRYVRKDPEGAWLGKPAVVALRDGQPTGLVFLPE